MARKPFEQSKTDVEDAGMREGSAREEAMDRSEQADDHLDKAPILPVKSGEAGKQDHTSRTVAQHAKPKAEAYPGNAKVGGESAKPNNGTKEDTSAGGPMKGMTPADRGFVSASSMFGTKKNQSRVI
jgi:hypothetical protein